MTNIPSITFGELTYREHEGENTFVESYEAVSFTDFSAFADSLLSCGFTLNEEHTFGDNIFKTFTSADETLFLSYYPKTGNLTLVFEPGRSYISFSDKPGESVCAPVLTHVDLKKYGLSYVIRLSDSRFIILDGGWDNDDSADKLMDVLNSQSVSPTPRIAAWIFTHPHADHYRCFQLFIQKYRDAVTIEKFILNFPDCSPSDELRFPPLFAGEESTHILSFLREIKSCDVPAYRAHTGQIYNIGDARLEILSSPDNTLFTPVKDINHLSLVIKTTICNQTIMWCSDADFEASKLAERYGSYLKCDIVQLTHHGYCGGRKKDYKLMNPSVCFAPVAEWDCLSYIDIHFDFNKYLFCDLELQKLFCGGSGNIELELPYYPPKESKQQLLNKVDAHWRALGANDWYFADLSPDELTFTFTNAAYYEATIYADFLFENSSDNIYFVKLTAQGRTSATKNIIFLAESGAKTFFDECVSGVFADISKKGKCSVHFMSDIPVVISYTKPPAYFR